MPVPDRVDWRRARHRARADPSGARLNVDWRQSTGRQCCRTLVTWLARIGRTHRSPSAANRSHNATHPPLSWHGRCKRDRDPDRDPGALKADTISAAELALSQKAFEITRPFGFPITDPQPRRRPGLLFAARLSPGPSHGHGPRQARFVTMDAATPAMP